jgi:hypothetical protein
LILVSTGKLSHSQDFDHGLPRSTRSPREVSVQRVLQVDQILYIGAIMPPHSECRRSYPALAERPRLKKFEKSIS